ncbi:MAG: hypothetical protein AAGB48_08340 [Planctomycetota bacterium]
MTQPSRLRFGHRTIRVDFTSALPADTQGHGDHDAHLIAISSQLDGPDAALTLVHELLHIAIARAGGAAALGIDETTEERIVSILSDALAEAVSRNKAAAEWAVGEMAG